MRHEGQGQIKRLADHLQRADLSARELGFVFDVAAVEYSIMEAVYHAPPARVRLRAFCTGAHTVQLNPLPAVSTSPVVLAIDDEPLNTADPITRYKTSLRSPYIRRMAKYPSYEDVVLINERGHVMETCIANIAALMGGRWVTPPLDSGCLPGIERAGLILNSTLVEECLVPADLVAASRLAVINSLRGWREARLQVRGSAKCSENGDRA